MARHGALGEDRAWTTAHDALFDFTRPTPAGWEWVNELAEKAAATQPVIAGMAAASHPKTSTARPAPEEVTAFLASYDEAHPGSFDFRQQRQVLAAATWVIAYNARCALSMMNDGDPPPSRSLLQVLNAYRGAYLTAYW